MDYNKLSMDHSKREAREAKARAEATTTERACVPCRGLGQLNGETCQACEGTRKQLPRRRRRNAAGHLTDALRLTEK